VDAADVTASTANAPITDKRDLFMVYQIA
jgi:hypothetical protein